MKDNILSALGFKVKNYSELKALSKNMEEVFNSFKVTITGHSKGNVPASILSGLTKFDALTFNPAGLSMRLAKKFGVYSKDAFKTVKYIVKEGDMLHDLQNRSTILKYLMPSAKGTGYLIKNNNSVLNKSTFTLPAYLGKIVRDGLINHGLLKMLKK